MHTESNSENNRQRLKVWYCRDCNSVHFRVGAVMLNFTREEFTLLTNACVDVYCEEFGFLSELTNSAGKDVLLSELIS